MLYFVSRAAKSEPNFKIPCNGDTAKSDSDSEESSGETWYNMSSMSKYEHPTYLIYESCLHEFFKYYIKCQNKKLLNFTKEL